MTDKSVLQNLTKGESKPFRLRECTLSAVYAEAVRIDTEHRGDLDLLLSDLDINPNLLEFNGEIGGLIRDLVSVAAFALTAAQILDDRLTQQSIGGK